jgi:hypothetical protein
MDNIDQATPSAAPRPPGKEGKRMRSPGEDVLMSEDGDAASSSPAPVTKKQKKKDAFAQLMGSSVKSPVRGGGSGGRGRGGGQGSSSVNKAWE